MTAERVLSIAHSQVGTGESPPFSNHNKFTVWYNQNVDHIGDGAWCDMFVTWVGAQANESHAVGRFAYCPNHVNWFRANGRWGHAPRVGAVVFFDWNGDGEADHVGFVKEVHNGYIVTIEGNSGNAGGGVVREVQRSSSILGYGYPAYTASGSGGSSKPPKGGGGGVIVGVKLTRILKLTNPYQTGEDIKIVQQCLNRRKYNLVEDGVYGPATRAAVISFQKKNGLYDDGEVGPKTAAKL